MAKANGKKKKTELAQVETTALVTAPQHITEGSEGFEALQAGDLVFPRAVLMQPLSPAVADKLHQPGDVINSVTNEKILAAGEPRAIVPVMFWHEWIEWSPRTEGGQMLGRSQDPESDLAKRAKGGEKRDEDGRQVFAVTEYLVFLVQPIDVKNPMDTMQMFCICCARTNFKHGRKLLTLARMRGKHPLYAGVYTLTSAEEQSPKGRYHVFNFANAGWAPKEIFTWIREQYGVFKEMTVTASAPAPEEDTTPSEPSEI